MRDTLTTPLPVDCHAPCANRRNDMTLNDEAEKQAWATTALPSFCVEAFTITKVYIKTTAVPKNWLVEQKDSALLILTVTTSDYLLQFRWYFVQ